MKKPPSAKLFDLLGLAVQAFAFVVLTSWVVTTTMNPPYGDLTRNMVLVVYAILIWSIPIYIKNRAHARLLNIAMWTVTGLIGIMLLPYIIGGLQDLMGGQCTGFFGVRGSCVDYWRLWLVFIFLPPIFVTILLVLGILMLRGDSQAVRGRK